MSDRPKYFYRCSCGEEHEMGTPPTCGGGFMESIIPESTGRGKLLAELRHNAAELRGESPSAPVPKLYLSDLLERAADCLASAP